MDAHTVKILGLILAASARVEGMKAENEYRLTCGNSPAYGEEAFAVEANYLESLAREIG